jgi:hypothetical protein
MFTVILLSRAARERYRLWREIFEPFLERNDIAICDWDSGPNVESLNDAIPGLSEVIRGKGEWRLLALGTATENLQGENSVDPENPFDYIRNWYPESTERATAPGLSLEESPYPLVRLSHLLLGYPEMGTNTFFPDLSYWDRAERKRKYESEYVAERESEGVEEDTAREEFRALVQTQHDVQTHYHQSSFSEEDERRYRNLIRKYEVRQSAPVEVVFVAIRDPKPQRPTDELRSKWRKGERADQSRFVARNDYHPACRFVVFDLHSEDHAAYELEELKYWLSVLSISINDLPASSFQAERLYQINVKVDPKILAQTLNHHMGLLTSARERLNREILKPRSTVTLDVTDLLRERPVSVSFEHLSGEHLSVPFGGYGLASDRPIREMGRWEQSYSELVSAAEQFGRKPRRVLAKAVEGVRDSMTEPAPPPEALSKIEREELEEELSQRARQLAESTTGEILDPKRLTDLLEREHRKIRALIRERMRATTILWSSILVAVIWLLVFVPFVIGALNDGGLALTESLLVLLGVAIALTSVGVGTLIYMRHKLVSSIQALNRALRGYVNDVKNRASAFGDFLAGLRTYMHGRALLDADTQLSVKRRRQNQKFLQDLHRIQEIIDREKSLVRSVGEPLEIKRLTNLNIDLVAWSPERMRRLLTLQPSTPGNERCVFSASGDLIESPYDFVTHLYLNDLGLREDIERHRQIIEDQVSRENVFGS